MLEAEDGDLGRRAARSIETAAELCERSEVADVESWSHEVDRAADTTRGSFNRIDEAVAALARGEFVVIADDADRENEGDLVLAAEKATPQSLGFMVRHTSGLICAPMLGERLDELRLPLMVSDNSEAHQTAFTVSIDYRPDISTGISAADRAATIRALANPAAAHADFTRPGHVFPLRYREGGVLKRAGHTEAAVDLTRLAGLTPASAICELTRTDGSMARLPELRRFATAHGLPLISIDDLVQYRRRTEKLVRPVGEARIPTRHGTFRAIAFRSLTTGVEHIALVMGDLATGSPLVRVHSECLTGETFGSFRCDCGEQIDAALERIAAERHGVLVYLRGHEGRGIGLGPKLCAYELQDQGLDTVEANERLGYPVDSRQYGIGAQILRHLGVTRMRLITNNPAKYVSLGSYGLIIEQRIPAVTRPTMENLHYLRTKQVKLGHLMGIESPLDVMS